MAFGTAFRRAVMVGLVAAAGCGVPIRRYPADVQTALARGDMRRMETELLVVYYPAGRRELAERMAVRIEACAAGVRAPARIDTRHAREKMFVVVPDAPFNNAYTVPPALGTEDVAVIPTDNTLDFATEFGLPPDPGFVGCHEVVHYVHAKQIDGPWGTARTAFGELLSPQLGFEPWFFEGLATYYEARLQPGAGRPRWPVFTGMFHAAYAGGRIATGDLSEAARNAPVGHHYLVGSMFVGFLAERYGDDRLWRLIRRQGRSPWVMLAINGRFVEVYGKGLGELFAEFRAWVYERFPVRERPDGERVVMRLGNDARWAWADDGTVAVIDDDVDVPTRLRVWDRDGRQIESVGMVDLVPPRRTVIAGPLLVSGMGFAGGELYVTVIDLDGTYQTTRLLRWRRGDGLREVAHGLGPGGAVSPDGRTYYHMVVDGDRWSLAARPLGREDGRDGDGGARVVWTARPGQYALRVRVSDDGTRLAVSAWDGSRFVVWVLDASSGERLAELTGAGQDDRGGQRPVYDAAFAGQRLVLLDEVDGRFQVAVAGGDGWQRRQVVSDTPYGALEPRVVGGRVRFLARDGWQWTLDEIELPAETGDGGAEEGAETVSGTGTGTGTGMGGSVNVISDRRYSRLDGLLWPSLHTLSWFQPTTSTLQVGVALGGGDRLDLVRWGVAAYVGVPGGELSAAGGLVLNDLAPWTIGLAGERTEWPDPERDADGTVVAEHERETRSLELTLGRVWRGSYGLAVGGAYVYDRTDDVAVRLYGPEAGVAWGAVEGTLHTGARRGWTLSGHGGYYPRRAGPLGDAAGRLDLYAPLPLGRRHVLHAIVRGHVVLGAERPLIRIGGEGALPPLWSNPEPVDMGVGGGVLPGQRRFTELVRGFEDLPLAAERVAIGELAWRYPIIIDRGSLTTVFLPPSFARQLDLELFAGGAVLEPDAARGHAAVGAAVTLRSVVFRVPLALGAQLAHRLTDDRGWSERLTLGVDL